MLQTLVRISQIAFFVLGAGVLAFFLWDRLGGDRRRDLDPFRRTLAERAVDRIVEELPRRDAIKRLLVMPVKGDFEEHVTDMLLERLKDRDEYIVIDARRYELLQRPPEHAQHAIKLAERTKDAAADGVLVPQATTLDFGRRGLGAKVDLEAHLVGLDSKANYPTDRVNATEQITSRFSVDWYAGTMEQVPWYYKLVLWVAVWLGLPFALFPVIEGVTRRENNRLNAMLLGGLTGVNVLLAAALLGFRPGLFGWLVVLLAGFAGFVYNFVMCDRIDETRK